MRARPYLNVQQKYRLENLFLCPIEEGLSSDHYLWLSRAGEKDVEKSERLFFGTSCQKMMILLLEYLV